MIRSLLYLLLRRLLGLFRSSERTLAEAELGMVSVDNQMFSVGNAFNAQLVDVFVDATTV